MSDLLTKNHHKWAVDGLQLGVWWSYPCYRPRGFYRGILFSEPQATLWVHLRWCCFVLVVSYVLRPPSFPSLVLAVELRSVVLL